MFLPAEQLSTFKEQGRVVSSTRAHEHKTPLRAQQFSFDTFQTSFESHLTDAAQIKYGEL
jgi:hypothetical protein